MRHHDAGDAQRVIELANQLCGGAQRNRIQPGKWLVVHDEFRVQHNGARQRHAPGHTAGNLARHQVARAAQANGIELHQHDVADHRVIQGGVLSQRKGHVVEHA